MTISKKCRQLITALTLLSIVVAFRQRLESTALAWQQKDNLPPLLSLRKVIKRDGWPIPGQDSFKVVSTSRQKEIEGIHITIEVFSSTTETFVNLDGYFLDDDQALIIHSGRCVVRDLLAYKAGGKTFAWEVGLVPVTNTEHGPGAYPGAIYTLFFIDSDGDGKFETRLGAGTLKEMPLWVKHK